MEPNSTLGEPIGAVHVTINGQKVPANVYADRTCIMPDGTIRLYDYLNDLELVASILAESHILVTGLSVSGDTLEDYFLSKIGGMKDVKSPKN